MKIDLTGRRALITGGSRGIGLAIAQAYAEAGADVAICARAEGPLKQAHAQLAKTGRRISAKVCDVSDAQAIKSWVEEAAAELGGVDILVNNASGFGRTDDEEVVIDSTGVPVDEIVERVIELGRSRALWR